MIMNLAAVARAAPLTAILLGACVSQSAYDQLQAQNQQLQAQNQQLQAQLQHPCRQVTQEQPALAQR